MHIITENLDENYLEIVLTQKEVQMIGDGDLLSKEAIINDVSFHVSIRKQTFLES